MERQTIQIVKSEAGIFTLEIALQAKRGLESAGFDVELVGFEDTNKIQSFTDQDLAHGEREIKKDRG